MSFNTTRVETTPSSNTNSNTFDGSGVAITSSLVSAKQGLDVNIINSSTSVSGVVDNTAFIYGNGVEQPVGGVYQDTSPTLTAGNTGSVRLTQYRGFHINLRDNSGVELGTSGNPIRNDPTGSTIQPVSGTVAATQSGAWNITNISGTISLPTGASTSANQTNASQKTQIVDGSGNVIASTTNALNVSVQNTVPISGTITANQGTSPWVVGQSTAANLNATIVGTGTFLVQAAQSGTWNINNISGTISLPTGASTEATLAKLTLTQGSTTSGQSGPLIQGAVTTAAPSYTTAQTSPLSLTTVGALRVDASGTTQPVSGTVTANQGTSPWVVSGTVAATQSGTWNIGTLTSITNAVTVSQGTAASLNATVVGTGTFLVQAAQSGTWNINNISGTISLPTGAATEASLAKLTLSQGSTTSGQSGALIFGAVTTAAPSYTTAQSSPLSLTTAGALRVDASASTQPISGTVTANQGGAPWSVNQTQWNGVTVSTGNGVVGTGVVRVAIASDNTAFSVNAIQSGSWSLAANQSVNVAQINGVTPLMGNGVTGTGSQRVTIASDNTAFSVNAVQSGTWNIGTVTTVTTVSTVTAVTAISNALPAGTNVLGGTIAAPSSSSSFAPTRAVSTALEASRVVKASAGNLYTLTGYNSKTSSQFIQVFNNSSLPADGAGTLIYTFVVAASSNFSLDFGTLGEQFSVGIVVCNSSTAATKTIGSADCWFTVRYQ